MWRGGEDVTEDDVREWLEEKDIQTLSHSKCLSLLIKQQIPELIEDERYEL